MVEQAAGQRRRTGNQTGDLPAVEDRSQIADHGILQAGQSFVRSLRLHDQIQVNTLGDKGAGGWVDEAAERERPAEGEALFLERVSHFSRALLVTHYRAHRNHSLVSIPPCGSAPGASGACRNGTAARLAVCLVAP